MTTPLTEIQAIETEYGRMIRRENGIIYFYMKDDLSVDLQTAQETVVYLKRLDDSGATRLLIVLSQNNDVQFEAQRYFSSTAGVVKLAMVVQNKFQVEVARFLVAMVKLFRSSYEMQPFNTVENAEKWLLSDN